VDPVLISRGGGGSQASSEASSPKQGTTSPALSPSKPLPESAIHTSSTMDIFSSIPGTLLKSSLTQSLTEKSTTEKVIALSSSAY
jgi:hypothetical protein